MELTLIPDQPAGGPASHHSDGLGFDVYAQILAQVASDTPGPFTIGVFGEWGTGKTSLMSMICEDLADHQNIVTVWFNAWRYEKEEHPVIPLVGSIVHELQKRADKSVSQKFANSAKALIRALRAVAYGFAVKSTVKIPGIADFEASLIAKDVIDRNEKLAPASLLDRSLYYEAFSALEKAQPGDELKVVVLIDDLDRCFPDHAIALLESIKLVLAQPGFIFVLGVARKVIEGYLEHRYSAEFGIAEFKGRLYLDKIVQLPFQIPPASGRMNEFCERILECQPTEISAQLKEVLVTAAETLGGNPRTVIRFVNNILVDLAINTKLADASRMGKIPMEYFAISRCLEHRWPEVLDSLDSSDELAQEVSSWDQGIAQEKAKEEEPGPKVRVASSLVSDPRLAGLLFSASGRSWLRDSDLRREGIEFLRTQRRISALDMAETTVDYDVYISYPAGNRSHVAELSKMLSEKRLRVHSGVREAQGTGEWGRLASTVLDRARVFCFCVGRDPAGEDHLERLRLRPDKEGIIPVILPGGSRANLPEMLRDRNPVDLSSGITRDKVDDQLVYAIRMWLRRESEN